MQESLDKTTVDTISLLEARLLRLEHLLYGPSTPTDEAPREAAVHSLAELEHRFSALLSSVRVYAELLKIYKSYPSLFQSPTLGVAPTQLSPEALRATVLSFATAFPRTASALTVATSDSPVPDAASSAALAALAPRARGVEALQKAQAAEAAELRHRSETVLRRWYEGRVLHYGSWVAEMERRVEGMETKVRRTERKVLEEKGEEET
ncbi:hypothetical protein VTK73DRAFT_1104 [Phialemonium thermophilum]|uniref:Nuclear distribution protein RO10 n=1 Tax=Phialemonium thermophilum TaxID=223376 RepID=A0ABR3XAY3_9PEZI